MSTLQFFLELSLGICLSGLLTCLICVPGLRSLGGKYSSMSFLRWKDLGNFLANHVCGFGRVFLSFYMAEGRQESGEPQAPPLHPNTL